MRCRQFSELRNANCELEVYTVQTSIVQTPKQWEQPALSSKLERQTEQEIPEILQHNLT